VKRSLLTNYRSFCSVLEASKTITLAEKSERVVEVIVAHENFQIIGTMNPGGDFGKKELSPALMNRFTSIWVPALQDSSELNVIVENRLVERLRDLSSIIVDVWLFFEDRIAPGARQNLTIREILCCVEFMNVMSEAGLTDIECLSHAVEMVVIDGLGLGSGVEDSVRELL
jgi:midasin